VTHFDQAFSLDLEFGHLHARWTMLGEAAGCQTVGVRRIEVAPGGWSTPAHEHGRSEEIFYVLAGSGLSWHNGNTAEIRAGDAILFAPRSGTHSIHAVDGPVDLLAYGTRDYDEAPRFPQLGIALIGVAHLFRAGAGELTYLAYGTRDNADICYYPHSNKLNFGGVRVIARLDRLDYWDGED
jgi:uncharacterized cupin superfamily protein